MSLRLLLACLWMPFLATAEPRPVTVVAPTATLQVICYHRFAQACGKDPYCVDFKDLDAQLAWLQAQGWQSVGLTQVAQALDGTGVLPPKAVMFSVDDGYKAGAAGAPHFVAHGFHGVFFVTVDSLAMGRLGAKSAFMRPEQLRALEAQGHDIGSHSMTHPNLAKPPKGMSVKAYQTWLAQELGTARQHLQTILGHPVTDLAWPFGAYNAAVIRAAQAQGYRQCYTVTEASVHNVAMADRRRLPRLLLTGKVPLASFIRRFAQRDAPGRLSGLQDGEVVYRDQLPMPLAKSPTELQLDGNALAGNVLGAKIRNGFHFLTDPGNAEHRSQRILFQIAPRAWEPYFKSLNPQP